MTADVSVTIGRGMGRALVGACLAVAVSSGAALAQDDDQHPVEAVTLSSGGLAEIRRSVSVDEATEIDITVPLDQIDDILKSLLIYDPAGGVASITLDGPSPFEETFRSLPFSPDDMSGLPRLLAALQGISVRVTSGARTVEGMVLGVDESHSEGEDAHPEPVLSVLTEEGEIVALRLRSDTRLDILDAGMREDLRRAAMVSGNHRTDDVRRLSIALEGTGARDVRLDYVVRAPVWKTAYRLILNAEGEARLQAWAVIENASGEDWRDVAVTLSSGAPVALAQRLHERYWHQRPEVPVLAQTITPPQPDQFREAAVGQAGRGADEEAFINAERVTAAPQAAPFPAPVPSAPVTQAEAAEGQTAATYRLAAPVDLPAGQTLSVPFVDRELPVERIALFRPERGDVHPIAALRLENTIGTSLPPGIVTVYAPQEEGYAGDAQLLGVPPGESRLLSFAADRKVEVRTERGREETAYRASLANGILRLTSVTTSETTYVILGAQDAARTVIIEHPRRQGWRFSSEALEATTPTHHRLRVEIEEGGSAEIRATSERTQTDSITLADADSATLLHWSGQLDNAQTAELLAQLAERQRDIARAEGEVAELSRRLENAANSQARIRENLAAVPADSTLAQRYIAMLEEIEDDIADIEQRRDEAARHLSQERQAFAQAIRDL